MRGIFSNGRTLGLATAILVAFSAAASAIPFSNSAVGGTVEVPGDYATLKDAADAFNGVAGGIQAPWTIEIGANLTEPANLVFGNAQNGFLLTIKPKAGTTPTVSFTQAVDNVGASGQFVVGPSTITAGGATYPAMGPILIDGSNNGTFSRDLTFARTDGVLAATNFQRMFRFRGNIDGITLKNLNVVMTATGTEGHAVEFTIQATNIPRNILIDNCDLQAIQSGGTGAAVRGGGAGSPAAGATISPITITNSTLRGGMRAIGIDRIADATITNNTISTSSDFAGAGSTYAGIILGGTATGLTGWTQTISGNTINGITGPIDGSDDFLSGMILTSAGGTVNVTNNIVRGYTPTSAAAVDPAIGGIIANAVGTTYNIYHNSISIPALATYVSTPAKAAGVAYTPTAPTGSLNLRNNIIRSEQPGSAAVRVTDATAASGAAFNANNNVYFTTGAGSVIGRAAATDSADISAWRTATSEEANTNVVDPTVADSPATGVWDATLRFTANPGPKYEGAGSLTPAVTTDIDGTTRSVSAPTVGADEAPVSSVNDWSMY